MNFTRNLHSISIFSNTTTPTPSSLKQTFSSLLKCFSSNPLQLKQIHALLLTTGIHIKNTLLTQLLTSLTLLGDMVYARRLFDEMHKPRSFLWTTLIKGYVRNELFLDGVLVYGLMHKVGVRPDKFTFPFVLKGCGMLDSVVVGRQVHVHVIKFGVELDFIVRTELMVFYVKFGELGSADYLFESMTKRDLISWNALISVYEQNGFPDKALDLFRRMSLSSNSVGVKPDPVTLVSALSASARLGCLEIGKEIDEIIVKEDIKRNIFINNARLDLYLKCGDTNAAREFFDTMPQRNVISWSTMIGGYAINGEGEKALELFSKMRVEGVRPNHVIFLAVLSACSHSGLINQGRSYFDYMISSNNRDIQPRLEHYACMVDLLGRSGLLEEAYEFIRSMPLEPDPGIWGALLGACVIHQNTELGQHVADVLLNLAPDIGSYRVLLSNIYAATGRWKDVEKVRLRMRSRRVKKTAGYSSVEANGETSIFFNGRIMSHLLSAKIIYMLEELNGMIRESGYVPVTVLPLHDIEAE